MKSIRILLPKSWTYSAEPAVAETAEDAEFIVNSANPAYGNNPYTVQVGNLEVKMIYVLCTINNSFITSN